MRFAQRGTAFADVGAFATDMCVMRRGPGHEVSAGYANLRTIEQGNEMRLFIMALPGSAMQQVDDRGSAGAVAVQAKLDMDGHLHNVFPKPPEVRNAECCGKWRVT